MLPCIKVCVQFLTNFERLPPGHEQISFQSCLKGRGSPSGHQERSADGVGGESDGGAAEEDAEAGHDQRGVESGHSGNSPHLKINTFGK